MIGKMGHDAGGAAARLRSALKPSQMDAMALADAVADSVLARIKEMNE